ncbi:Metal binding domain of Ada [Nonomuraea solani]|uniref:Metal binding domain of Ada n=1 Tax=Nonomuraea solani TaxID=1144553 RepID=A0A1H6BIH9_9ACTN|nr:Ada metal-binding domain-containing protein [Nonomuraea solani]SEG60185.1 Metal binding domain of Ada [Nonomuraea solani]
MRYTLIGPDGRPYPSPVPGTLGGHRGARLYGRLDCPSALRAIAGGGYVRNRAFFADAATAMAAGYRPCAVCLTEEYRRWRKHRERRAAPGEPAREIPAVIQPGAIELARVVELLRGAQTVVVGHGRGAGGVVEAFQEVWEGTVLAVVSWPEVAASWLRQARRFVAGEPDAWVVAGAARGWAGMSERLRRSTDWDPSRTVGFADTAGAVTMAPPGTLEGMRGADHDGNVWRIGRNVIFREES